MLLHWMRSLSFVLALSLCLLSSHASAEDVVSLWQKHVRPWMNAQVKKVPVKRGKTTPTEAIKDLDSMLDDYRMGEELSVEDRKFNKTLKKRILNGTFDIRELCRIAFGPHWGQRTDKERDHVVSLLKQLLEERAVSSKEHASEKSGSKDVYRVRYTGERYLDPQKTRASVKSVIHIPSHNLNVEIIHKLQIHADGWKIYDVVVDGSSLVENYAYQFDSIIRKHGYPDLIKRMESKLNDFRVENGDV